MNTKSIVPAVIRSTQSQFTEALRAAVTARGFDFAADQDYANTGNFRARHGGTFEQVLEVRYGFHLSQHNGYATFEVASAKGRDSFSAYAPDLQAALDRILGALPAPKISAAKTSVKKRRADSRARHERRAAEGVACPVSCVVCGGAS